MSLKDRMVLVQLSIGKWDSWKHDKIVTAELAESKHAEPGTTRTNKRLFSKAETDVYNKPANLLRTYHYANTLPWSDGGTGSANIGWRCLPLANGHWEKYTRTTSQKIQAFRDGYEKFLTEIFPNRMERNAERLGDMFNLDDYPTIQQLRRKFYAQIVFEPVADLSDFRVTASDAEMQSAIKAIEARKQAQEETAMRELWDRTYEVVKNAVDKLSHFGEPIPNSKRTVTFRDSFTTNVLELADLLPRMNLTGDARLDRLATDLRNAIGNYDSKALREDEDARDDVLKEVKKAQDAIESTGMVAL